MLMEECVEKERASYAVQMVLASTREDSFKEISLRSSFTTRTA